MTDQPTPEQLDPDGGATWALLENETMLTGPAFAAQIVKKTAARVSFRIYRQGESAPCGHAARHVRIILAEGLTRRQAERAVELDDSSRALRDQEVKAAKQRHQDRRAKIVAQARQP